MKKQKLYIGIFISFVTFISPMLWNARLPIGSVSDDVNFIMYVLGTLLGLTMLFLLNLFDNKE